VISIMPARWAQGTLSAAGTGRPARLGRNRRPGTGLAYVLPRIRLQLGGVVLAHPVVNVPGHFPFKIISAGEAAESSAFQPLSSRSAQLAHSPDG
jgi:hypothetical protein